MFLVLEPETAGYVVLGPLLRRLEGEHDRLPATFLQLFTRSLDRWLRTYDYRDAQQHVEMLREWYEGDPDAEDVELPNVDAAIPAYVAKSKPMDRRLAEQCARRIRNAELRSILQGALELSEVAGSVKRPGYRR